MPEDSSFFLGQRFDMSKEGDRATFQKDFYGKLPCVCLNSFQSEVDNDLRCEGMATKLGSTMIEYDSRDQSEEDGVVSLETFECTLSEYLAEVGEGSDHLFSMYFISEDIMQLEEARTLSSSLELDSKIFGDDLFQYFPESIRPEKALIIGGVGSRSFLHADPYEWTGWNYCLEGLKLWSFFPPETNYHEEGGQPWLKTKRTETNAWGEYNVAAGWQSDIDLYHRVLVDKEDGVKSPLNKHWERVYRECEGNGEKVTRPPRFASSDTVLEAEEDLWPLDAENIALDGDSGDSEDAGDVGSVPSMVNGAIQIVQRPGETVMIPPGWLHQAYSLTPSIAVAGQYMNSQNKERVVQHIMDWCGATGKLEEEAREQEKEEKAKKQQRQRERDNEVLLEEFYGKGGDGSGGDDDNEKKRQDEGIDGDVELTPELLSMEPSEMVPELLRSALLARYRRLSVAREVFEEIYLDSAEE